MQTVAVLFARTDSHYKTMEGVDVWDIDRDARNWPCGGATGPVVAQLALWWRTHLAGHGEGCGSSLSRARAKNFWLSAPWQTCGSSGGVLEHPAESSLWLDQGLPRPGDFPDAWGGWTLAIEQFHWGHRAEKATWLYIVGAQPDDLPTIPVRPGRPTHCVRPTKSYPRLPSITKREREATPPEFGAWLVEVARRCKPPCLDSLSSSISRVEAVTNV